MSVKMQLDDGVILTFIAPWTWDECELLSPAIQTAFDSASDPIDLIVDLRQAGNIPNDVISQLRDAYAEGMDNLDEYIFVGASPEFELELSVADRYLTAIGGVLNYRFVDTMEEAQRVSKWKNLLRELVVS